MRDNTKTTMIKYSLAAAVAVPFISTAAVAGPYVNLETNSKLTGTDYGSTTSHLHAGYTDKLGSKSTWYVQAGPAVVAADGEPAVYEYSGKAGIKTKLSDNLKSYVEVSFMTVDQGGEDNKYGTKAGLTYSF